MMKYFQFNVSGTATTIVQYPTLFKPKLYDPGIFSGQFTCGLSAFNFLARKWGQNSLQQIKGPKLQLYNNDNLDLFHDFCFDFWCVLSLKVYVHGGWAVITKIIVQL